ncbi:hypothetical protein JG688_00002530 [Phytophthora aleatoria]|uniref:Uncharacterized protein n=1 Tax=Phytophthora aleatoria TaxID=2496075 RepID=A0A8J5MIQ4_9STRA|nr:hypothetical protein JG688_00002530 [Phytophthora aleatoria]
MLVCRGAKPSTRKGASNRGRLHPRWRRGDSGLRINCLPKRVQPLTRAEFVEYEYGAHEERGSILIEGDDDEHWMKNRNR